MLESLRKYVSAFVTLTDEEFAALSEKLVIRNFDKKRQLVGVGDVEEYLNFLVKGLARKFFKHGKSELITQIAQEGEMISSSTSFLSGEPSLYNVETITASTFLSISRKDLDALYQRHPTFERVGRLIILHLFLQKEQWEDECIRLDSRARFQHFSEQHPDMMDRVPQKYLASYLNMKPETFSRLKSQAQQRGAASEKARNDKA